MFRLLLRALSLWLSGSAFLDTDLYGREREVEGEVFRPFRRLVLDPGDPGSPAGAIFQVRFHFRNLPMVMNRLLSLIPVPLILAQPGFRSKTWLLGRESDDFVGYYEFETVRDAQAYWSSLPLGMMRRRAAEGSLTWSITEVDVGKA